MYRKEVRTLVKAKKSLEQRFRQPYERMPGLLETIFPITYVCHPDEMPEIHETITAITYLRDGVTTLDRRGRRRMPTRGGNVAVWPIESAVIRGCRAFVNRTTVFLQLPSGMLEPIKPRACGGISNRNGLSSDEIYTLARAI